MVRCDPQGHGRLLRKRHTNRIVVFQKGDIQAAGLLDHKVDLPPVRPPLRAAQICGVRVPIVVGLPPPRGDREFVTCGRSR